MPAILAALEALLTNPTVDAAILSAAQVVYDFFKAMTPAAVAAAEEAAEKQSAAQVADFVTGSAADLADAQRQLALLLAHPDLPPGLVPTVESIRAQLAARVAP